MHALAQRASRDRLAPSDRNRLLVTAADALNEAWPEGEWTPGEGIVLDAHHDLTEVLAINIQALVVNDASDILTHVDLWPGRRGAHPVLSRYIMKEVEGEADLLRFRTRLIEGLDGAAAIRECELLIADMTRVFGPDHPDTLAAPPRARPPPRAGGPAHPGNQGPPVPDHRHDPRRRTRPRHHPGHPRRCRPLAR
jgi:hypothetical protein